MILQIVYIIYFQNILYIFFNPGQVVVIERIFRKFWNTLFQYSLY